MVTATIPYPKIMTAVVTHVSSVGGMSQTALNVDCGAKPGTARSYVVTDI